MSGFFLVLVSMHWIISVVDMIIITHIATILYVRFTWKKLQQFSTLRLLMKNIKRVNQRVCNNIAFRTAKVPKLRVSFGGGIQAEFFVK
ncbi:hypothetical protein EAO22_00270 [Klebsiella pneumoniae]|nr:hypothetical protein EAO22_00270 [Klebsiella pneumoniae]